MKNKFTRAGLAAILKNAEFWLANPAKLKIILTAEVITAEFVRDNVTAEFIGDQVTEEQAKAMSNEDLVAYAKWFHNYIAQTRTSASTVKDPEDSKRLTNSLQLLAVDVRILDQELERRNLALNEWQGWTTSPVRDGTELGPRTAPTPTHKQRITNRIVSVTDPSAVQFLRTHPSFFRYLMRYTDDTPFENAKAFYENTLSRGKTVEEAVKETIEELVMKAPDIVNSDGSRN